MFNFCNTVKKKSVEAVFEKKNMPDFWDIDDILITEESVDCIFSTIGVGLGHLDPLLASTGTRDV